MKSLFYIFSLGLVLMVGCSVYLMTEPVAEARSKTKQPCSVKHPCQVTGSTTTTTTGTTTGTTGGTTTGGTTGTTTGGTTGSSTVNCGDLGGNAYCGKLATGTSAYTDEGGSQSAFQTGATPLSDCNLSLAASTSYYLTQSVTAAGGDGNNCFNLTTATKLDLNGFTVNGRINRNGNFNGAHLFNGTIRCTFTESGSDTGCIRLVSTSNVTATATLHHLDVKNLQTGANNARAIHIEWTPTTNAANTVPVSLSNNTTEVITNTSSRSVNISITGNQLTPFLATLNRVTCDADASACQGILFFNAVGTITRNYISQPTLTASESGRCITIDANAIPASDIGVDVTNNMLDCANNRFVRVRSRIARGDSNTYISPCNISSGAVHLYDQNQSSSENYTGLTFNNEKFVNPCASSTMFYMVAGTGAKITNTIATGSISGRLAWVRNLNSAGPTTATFCSNAQFSATANLKATIVTGGSAVITAYNSGVKSSTESTGTVNQVIACP